MDYAGNADKQKQGRVIKSTQVTETTVEPEGPKIEKVVTGEVKVKKKGLGDKAKDLLIAVDLKSVANFVATDVLLPALRNLIVDTTSKGVERMMYGDRPQYRRPGGTYGGRVTYNTTATEMGGAYRPMPNAMRPDPGMTSSASRQSRDNFVIVSKPEADQVLDTMLAALDQFGVVAVADLHELVGHPVSHVDHKWGWYSLAGAQIRQIREGYMLDLPPATAI
jgi:hypothetical protein